MRGSSKNEREDPLVRLAWSVSRAGRGTRFNRFAIAEKPVTGDPDEITTR